MSKVKVSVVLAVGTAIALMFGFQNCGQLKASKTAGLADSSSVDGGSLHTIATQSSAVTVYKDGSQVSDALNLALNQSYEIRVDLENLVASNIVWQANSGVGGFANCTLTGADLLKRTLMCSSLGMAHVQAAVTYTDGTSQTKVFERNVAESGVVTPPGNLVTFRISDGTANKGYNTAGTPVTVFKGQTLHIVNDDTTVHRLHTPGSPCPHEPANISTGQSYDCVIAAAHTGNLTNMYDHVSGPSSVFYLNAIDGAAQYARKFTVNGQSKACMDCHGALANSAVKKASLASIKANIAANAGGMGAITLTDDELNSIVYELNK